MKTTNCKLAHSALKLETIKLNTWYTLNLNPVDPPIGCDINDDKFNMFYGHTYKFFQSLKYSKIILYIELSPTGRIHFHGTVCPLRSVIGFTLHDIPIFEKFGTYKIDTISDESIWKTYITKQVDLWKPVLKGNVYGYPLQITPSLGKLFFPVIPPKEERNNFI